MAELPRKVAWRRQPPLSVKVGVEILGEWVRKQWAHRSARGLYESLVILC